MDLALLLILADNMGERCASLVDDDDGDKQLEGLGDKTRHMVVVGHGTSP